jgi:hypothetical protein
VRDVEADHRHVDAALEHARRSLGVAPDVELGGGRHVPLGNRAAHENDALGSCVRMEREQKCHVRQRADRNERDGTLRAPDLLREEVGRVRSDGLALRWRQIGPVEARLAVHVRGDELVADERTIRAGCDRNLPVSGELEHADRVRRRLVECLVSRDGRHAEHLDLG